MRARSKGKNRAFPSPRVSSIYMHFYQSCELKDRWKNYNHVTASGTVYRIHAFQVCLPFSIAPANPNKCTVCYNRNFGIATVVKMIGGCVLLINTSDKTPRFSLCFCYSKQYWYKLLNWNTTSILQLISKNPVRIFEKNPQASFDIGVGKLSRRSSTRGSFVRVTY